ncbi:MAG: ABC transporter ATP-binding protein [Planctomycetaceae bacterium]|nr:ABC transporter ATP-binding protein [Planctomycetaceae bacterium]
MSGQSHVLEARGLSFQYRPDQPPVLEDISINAAAGRLLALLGPNGSGKTTLLRCLLGWLRPQGGSIRLDGKELTKYSRKALARVMAYVPQFPTSAFAFTVSELVLMGRFAHVGVLGLAAKQDRNVARAAMEMTDTLAFADRTLGELSGGEAQRVMIARALAQQPQVLLLDEPTSNLDIKHQLKIHQMMQRLAHDWEMAVVCVSHDVNLAAQFADELVLMRGGRVVADGKAGDVVRSDVLAQTYGVDIRLIDVPGRAVPIVTAE